jgi:hypothetical protein
LFAYASFVIEELLGVLFDDSLVERSFVQALDHSLAVNEEGGWNTANLIRSCSVGLLIEENRERRALLLREGAYRAWCLADIDRKNDEIRGRVPLVTVLES